MLEREPARDRFPRCICKRDLVGRALVRFQPFQLRIFVNLAVRFREQFFIECEHERVLRARQRHIQQAFHFLVLVAIEQFLDFCLV